MYKLSHEQSGYITNYAFSYLANYYALLWFSTTILW
jgi:hypothetical protein